MEPPPRARSSGIASLVIRATPRRLTRRISSHTAKSASSMPKSRVLERCVLAALLTSPSTPPSAAQTRSYRVRTDCSSATSRGRASACPPRARSAAAWASAPSPFRSATTTRAPSAASTSQVPAPMPEAPPVTITTLSCRRFMRTSSKHRHQAAVDEQGLAGDVAETAAADRHHRAADVLARPTHAAHREVAQESVLQGGVLLEEGIRGLGAGRGRDGIDGDAVRPPLARQRLDEAAQRALARGVDRIHAGAVQSERRVQADIAAMAAALEVRERGLGAMQAAVHADRELLLPGPLGDLAELRRMAGQAARSIVDHDVEAAECFDRVGHGLLHVLAAGDVGLQRQRRAA